MPMSTTAVIRVWYSEHYPMPEHYYSGVVLRASVVVHVPHLRTALQFRLSPSHLCRSAIAHRFAVAKPHNRALCNVACPLPQKQ